MFELIAFVAIGFILGYGVVRGEAFVLAWIKSKTAAAEAEIVKLKNEL